MNDILKSALDDLIDEYGRSIVIRSSMVGVSAGFIAFMVSLNIMSNTVKIMEENHE